MMRTVEDLPLVPTTWIDVEALLRAARAGHQPAHAVQAEAHPEQLHRQQEALGLLRRPALGAQLPPAWPHASVASQRVELRAQPLELARWASTTGGGRLGHEALVGQLALGARDLGSQLVALGARGGAAGRRGSTSDLEHRDVPAGHRDRGHRLGVAAALPEREVKARQARDAVGGPS